MKKYAVTGAALILASAASVNAQEVYDNRWYIGGTLGGYIADNDRESDENWPYYGVYIGRFLTPNFSLDLRIDQYDAEFDVDDVAIPAGVSNDFDLTSYGLVGRYHFGEDDGFRPYGLAAIGIQEHDSFLDDGRDIYASLGFGASAEVNDHWDIRTELEARYDNDRQTFDRESGFVDLIFSVGLSYSFGEKPRPAVAAAPEPAPQPVVEPAPRPRPAPPPPPPEPEVIFEFDSEVTFAFDSDEIRPSAEGELNRAAAILSDRTEIIVVEVAGHTDNIGTEAYNQDLSERRAQAVADYLVNRGIDRDRMVVRGFGETRPKVANDTPENRQMNRRVVITVLERSD